MKKILIISGGSVASGTIDTYVNNHTFDHIIAADAGLDVCDLRGIMPTDILGDFDSLTRSSLPAVYKERGCTVRQYPARKDYTDTHLAIFLALEILGDDEGDVTILGGTGTRFDHTLANAGLLTLFADRHIRACIADEHNEIRLLKGPDSLCLSREESWPYISLLPFSETCTGITAEGFAYPLCDASMKAFSSLGISNEIIKKTGTIHVEDGYLLIIRSRD